MQRGVSAKAKRLRGWQAARMGAGWRLGEIIGRLSNQIDCDGQRPIELGQLCSRKSSDKLRQLRFLETGKTVAPYPAFVLHAFINANAHLRGCAESVGEDRCADH